MDLKTKELVENAERRTNAATPGPWACRPSVDRRDALCDDVIAKGHGNVTVCGEIELDGEFDDGSFIAHAREDVPKLCAAVREYDKIARHASEERDAFGKRIEELEAENERLRRTLNRTGAVDGVLANDSVVTIRVSPKKRPCSDCNDTGLAEDGEGLNRGGFVPCSCGAYTSSP